MKNALLQQIKNGWTVLTPSRRLATHLKEAYNQAQTEKQKVWPSPSIFAYEDWLKLLWDQYEIDGYLSQYLLSINESLLGWEAIIQRSSYGKTLLRPLAMAKLAMQAWSLLHQWRALNLLQEPTQQIDQMAFQQWANTYQTWLDENNFCDLQQMPEQLLSLLGSSPQQSWQRVMSSQQLVLYGFEEFSPEQTYFFDTLKHEGWKVEISKPVSRQPQLVKSLSFESMQDEWQAAALWAKALLAENQQKIAVIVPNLVDHRQQIEKVFNDVLSILQVCEPNAQVNRLFNISAAIPLYHYPIMQSALSILAMACEWSFDNYIQLVQNPFVGGSESEFLIRARYLKVSQTQLQTPHNLQQVLVFLENLPAAEKPQGWENSLKSYYAYLTSLPAEQSWFQWSEHFQKLLSVMGWPGERTLNSIEYQAFSRWHELVQSLAAFDNVLPPVSFKQAYTKLLMLVMHTPFQPENKRAPIQILGLLEGVGQEFDHLWVMGLHNEAWPPQADPNPFIALHWQRQLNMPHASAQRQTEYARKMTERLKQCAKEVIFSYPRQDRGRPLEMSELIREIPSAAAQVFDVVGAEKLFSPASLEKISDQQAPPIDDKNFVARSQTLALQAFCPFKAFAQERLAATETVSRQAWLLPFQRGVILHKILEKFWSQVKNQKTLNQLKDEECAEKLERLIDQQLTKYCPIQTPGYYRRTEKARLIMILQQYLQLEKKRPSFQVVALEQEQFFEFAGMQFRLRCDRIDQDENDQFILMDYKTGEFKLTELWGERPSAPQLGLYFLAWQHYQPQAIGIIKLSLGKCEWVGLHQEFTGIEGIKQLTELREKNIPSRWEELTSYWHNQLYHLAQAFKSGSASIDPIQGKQSCQFCHLQSICRVGET